MNHFRFYDFVFQGIGCTDTDTSYPAKFQHLVQAAFGHSELFEACLKVKKKKTRKKRREKTSVNPMTRVKKTFNNQCYQIESLNWVCKLQVVIEEQSCCCCFFFKKFAISYHHQDQLFAAMFWRLSLTGDRKIPCIVGKKSLSCARINESAYCRLNKESVSSDSASHNWNTC